MKSSSIVVAISLVFAMTMGCTAYSSHVYPKQITDRYTITTGDVDRPYESLGYIQLTKKGFDLFAILSIIPADLSALFGQELIPVLERTGADGIINVQFRERQWTPAERIGLLFSIVGIFWIPTQAELTGELIRYTNGPTAAVTPAPALVPGT